MIIFLKYIFFIITVSANLANAAISNNWLAEIKNSGAMPKVKVRVKKSLSKIQISGTDLFRKFHVNNKKGQSFSGRKRIHFNCKNFTKRNNKFEKPLLIATLSSQTGLVTLMREKFIGKLHVITSTDKSSCDVVNEAPIESYISSLLSKEMNASWDIEALKAQAIAARTYALHKIKTKQTSREIGAEAYYDLENSEKHQVSGNFFDATSKTFMAAKETEGEILVSGKGKLTATFFHAKCGGYTLRPDQVWENKVDGYERVPCPFCGNRGKKNWRKTISIKRFKNFLKWAHRTGKAKINIKNMDKMSVRITPDKYLKNKMRIYLGDSVVLMKKTLLRRYFGRFIIPSNHFKLVVGKQKIHVRGKGLGHGVGLCQLGALDLAQKGWGYRRILAHYFPGHNLIKAY